jgi:hypothetical protein
MLDIFEIPLETLETPLETVLEMFALTFETPVEMLLTLCDTLLARESIKAYGSEGIIAAQAKLLFLPPIEEDDEEGEEDAMLGLGLELVGVDTRTSRVLLLDTKGIESEMGFGLAFLVRMPLNLFRFQGPSTVTFEF